MALAPERADGILHPAVGVVLPARDHGGLRWHRILFDGRAVVALEANQIIHEVEEAALLEGPEEVEGLNGLLFLCNRLKEEGLNGLL
eukprot:g14006.t1